MQAAPRLRQPSSQILDMPLEARAPSDHSATRNNNRTAPSPLLPAAPLGNISNKVLSSSTDENMPRVDSAVRKPSRVGMAASEGPSSWDNNDGRPRVGSRTSLGGRRSLSGAKVSGPSALRRLPPGVAPRSIVPSMNGTDDGTRDRVASGSRPAIAALARVNQAASGPRRSLGASINAAASGSMAQHDREVREVAKLSVDSTSFEEWMKMATDNKINATNTWNFALIDYFHDMSLLRSDNGDGSINFQKASCTLDGCVKVWTSRVDSVVTETGKLLSGLQDDGKDSNTKSSRARAGEDNDEDGAEEEDENGVVTKKRKTRAREPTLAKSFAQLAVKKLDLEFTVDPLFKKTSADFDEGGAGGLLMNHLGVDSNARVVFDAGDVAGVGDDEQEEIIGSGEEQAEEEDDQEESPAFADQVDLTKIRNKLFSQSDAMELGDDDALGSLLSDLVICPTFASFKFAPGDDTPFSALAAENAESAPPAFSRDYLPALEEYEGEDDFQDMPAFDDDGQDDAFGNADPFGGGPTGYEYNEQDYEDGGMGMTGREVIPADAPIDFATAFQGITDQQGVDLNGDGFFDYFDQRLTKNWAGPEHWKMKKNIGMGPPPAQRGDTSTGNGAEKATRKSKEPFVVDFCSDEGAVLAKTIFEPAPAKGGAAITLPVSKDATTIDTYLLPEDRHFTSRHLLRLFIKPRAMLNLKRKGVMVAGESMQDGASHPADVDEAFWAQAAAIREGSRGSGASSEYADAENGGMAYDTPFFQFGDDDGGFDGMDEGAEGGMDLDPNDDDEELTTQALKRIRPEYVNYAKKAKRVDVRKLKENIWKQLAIEAAKGNSDDSEEEEEDEGDEEGDQSATPRAAKLAARASEALEPRVFQSVLSGLRKTYPKDRMDEISTSFCFICLLHLANEEGLEINTEGGQGAGILDKMSKMAAVIDDEDDDALGEDRRGEERVGFLEQLSIVKDPNAGRSA